MYNKSDYFDIDNVKSEHYCAEMVNIPTTSCGRILLTFSFMEACYTEAVKRYKRYIRNYTNVTSTLDSNKIVAAVIKTRAYNKFDGLVYTHPAERAAYIAIKSLFKTYPKPKSRWDQMIDLDEIDENCPIQIRSSILIRRSAVSFDVVNGRTAVTFPMFGKIQLDGNYLFPATENINHLRIVYKRTSTGAYRFFLKCESFVTLKESLLQRTNCVDVSDLTEEELKEAIQNV